MSITALPPIGFPTARDAASAPARPTGEDFGALVRQGLEQVSDLERAADATASGFAVGDGTKVHEVMTAGAKSQLGIEVLAQVRNRAVEAYTEIMRLQV